MNVVGAAGGKAAYSEGAIYCMKGVGECCSCASDM